MWCLPIEPSYHTRVRRVNNNADTVQNSDAVDDVDAVQNSDAVDDVDTYQNSDAVDVDSQESDAAESQGNTSTDLSDLFWYV